MIGANKIGAFTLLEVLVAMVVLTVGMTALLWQFGLAVDRFERARRNWEVNHELRQAAEYLLLAGPEAKLDTQFLNPAYQVKFEYAEPELSYEDKMQLDYFQLITLTIQVSDPADTVLDELKIDCWKDSLDRVP